MFLLPFDDDGGVYDWFMFGFNLPWNCHGMRLYDDDNKLSIILCVVRYWCMKFQISRIFNELIIYVLSLPCWFHIWLNTLLTSFAFKSRWLIEITLDCMCLHQCMCTCFLRRKAYIGYVWQMMQGWISSRWTINNGLIFFLLIITSML